jgi:prepilin-type processing-associated H-X9-DG protein
MRTLHSPASGLAGRHPNQDQQAGAGFSQVDLLTLIAVLVLLGLLLSPALAHTRATDQTLQCRNNLRQLMHGWRMYAEDNSGKLPNCFDWVSGWESYVANNPDNTNINYLLNGLLGPYVTNPAVYKCPADQSQAIEGVVRLPRVRSYSMSQSFCNANEGHLEDGGSPPNFWRHYTNTTDMIAPAPVKLWVLLGENPDSLNDGAFAVNMAGGNMYGGNNNPNSNGWQDGPSNLHDGGCGFAFADGHYELKKWTDSRTLALKPTYTQSFPYGIVEPNNPDIQWVKDRTTAPKL